MKDRLYELADRLMRENGLDKAGWTFGINTRTVRRLGQCSYTKKHIEVSGYVVNCAPYQYLANIVIHEVAHALCPHQQHNHVWKTKAWQLGATVVEVKTSLSENNVFPKDRDLGFAYTQILLLMGEKTCERLGGSKKKKKNLSVTYLTARRVETLGNIYQVPVAVWEAFEDGKLTLGDVHIYVGLIDNTDGRHLNKAEAIANADTAPIRRTGVIKGSANNPTALAVEIFQHGMTFEIFSLKYRAARPQIANSTLKIQYSRARIHRRDLLVGC